MEFHVPKYLVEAYIPRSRLSEARVAGRDARAAAEELAREGTPVCYVRTTFLPDDETCFHVFEAASEEAVGEVCRRAGIGSGRIVPAVE
jgi:Nickel responsive protein SCO4226-like